jgi:hypothetical protein
MGVRCRHEAMTTGRSERPPPAARRPGNRLSPRHRVLQDAGSSLLKKSLDASFAALLDPERPDFAEKSYADLGIELGPRLAMAAALPFFNSC